MGVQTAVGGLGIPRIAEILNQIGLFIAAQNQIHAGNLCHRFALELGITTRDNDESLRIEAHHLVDCLPALVVGNLGYRTRVDEANVGLLIFGSFGDTHIEQATGEGACFREVEFASQRVESRRFALKYRRINHFAVEFISATTYSERVPMRNFPPHIPMPDET